jgi:peptide subunit release factor 1 (eRF1)
MLLEVGPRTVGKPLIDVLLGDPEPKSPYRYKCFMCGWTALEWDEEWNSTDPRVTWDICPECGQPESITDYERVVTP